MGVNEILFVLLLCPVVLEVFPGSMMIYCSFSVWRKGPS